MINVTDSIKKAYEESTTQYDKIILDGQEYDINNVQYEDDCYLDGNIFGTAIARTLDFEIENIIDLENKEFKYLTGIKTENGIEWISLGNFITQEVEPNDTTGINKVNAMDYMLKSNITYESNLDYESGTVTMLQVLQEACQKAGIELATTDFANANFIVDSNQFDEDSLIRQVFQAVAQISGTFAKVRFDNKLYFKTPKRQGLKVKDVNKMLVKDLNALPVYKLSLANFKMKLNDYSELILKRNTHPINLVSLGMSNVEGENVVLKDEESIKEDGENSLIINDNPFAYTEGKRKQLINELFDKVKGFEYTSFEITGQAKPYQETGDEVAVINSDGTYSSSFLFRFNYKSPNGLESEMSAPSITKATVNYQNVATAEQIAKRTELRVDKQEQKIVGIIEQQTETGKKLTQVEQTVDGITQTVSSVETKVETVENKAEQAQTSADNAQSTADEAISKITTTTNKVSEIEQTVDNITSTVSSVETKVEQVENKADIANSNAQKAQSSADTAQSTAENAQNTADNATKQITTTNQKVSQIDQTVSGITQSVSAVEEKVETVETKADNAQSSANNAQSTANTANQNAQNAQTTANNINNNLTQNYYTKTETNSQISQKADEITSTVSQTYSTKTETTDAKNEAIESANASTDEKLEDYSTTEEMNSAITQKADSITQEVTQKVENIQIGGTNLIPNSAPYNLDDYLVFDSTYIERALQDEPTAPFGKCLWIHTLNDLPSMLGVYIIPTPQVLEDGKEYCFSLWLKATANTTVTVGYARGGQTTFNVTTEYKKFTHKFTALAPTAEAHGFAIYLPAGTVPGRQVFVHSIKLEEGNKNTDWSPAPSDVASKEEMNSKIEQTANKIEMTVQQEINTITGENSIRNGTFENGLQNWNIFASQGDVQVTEYGNKKYAELITMNGETKLTQTITGLIEEIDYKLSFKVLSKSFIPTGTTFTTKIWQTKNNSEELILLKSQEVELNETEKSINIEFNMLYAGDVDIEFELSISSFSPEEISAMVTDVVVAGGSISERFASLKVGLDGIESEVSKKVGNNEIISKINQSSETVGINANRIELSANDVLNLLAGNTINLSGKSIKISSNNFNVDANGKMTCKGAEISGKVIVGGDEEEPEFIATDGNFRTTVFPLGLLNEVNGEYAAVMKGGLGVGTYTSTGMSEKVTINSEGIIAPKVTQTSLAEQKKNFEKMQNIALNIIKTIDIYKYNLKSEKDTDKKHIGFVIGDDYKYAKEVTSIDNTGVDNYSFTSLCCKAIQEQQQQIEQLQKEILELRKEET